MSIPFFSAGRQLHSRTVSLTKTWTAGRGGWDQGQADWTTWIRRSGSAAPSQVIIRRDEEAGDRSEIQTRISDIDENEVSTVIRVRNRSLQHEWGLTVSAFLSLFRGPGLGDTGRCPDNASPLWH